MTEEEKKDYIQELIYDLNDPQCAILDKDKLEYAVMKALEKGLAKENAELTETASVTQLMELIQVRQENAEQKAQIEKMKSFIHSEIDFCMYCPLTNECRNDEGTCPYAYATEEEQKNLLMDFIKNWELAE